MSDLDSSCPFDLLDAAMRDPFLQQAFRQLDQRHLYGIIARVCRSWHYLSTTSNSSLKVKVSIGVNEETGEPDAAISFSRWLQRNIGNLTRLDLTFDGENYTFNASEVLQAITSATQLCSLRLDLEQCLPEPSYAGLSALTTLTSLALCGCDLTSHAFSSIFALTQLRALCLFPVDVDVYGIMPDLTRSLVNLTRLTLDNYDGRAVGHLESGLACIRSLTKLVDLDLRNSPVPSGNLVNLLRGLPVTGIEISLDDSGHVSKVAGWLERCVPSILRHLNLCMPRYPGPVFELQPSQLVGLLSPLRSAGAQLQEIQLWNFDMSQADSVSIITGLTQLTSLTLYCKFHDDGWALLEPAFACLEVREKRKVDNAPIGAGFSMSHFVAEAVTALLSRD